MAEIEPHECTCEPGYENLACPEHGEEPPDDESRSVCWTPVRGTIGSLEFAHGDGVRPLTLRGLRRLHDGGRLMEHTFWASGAFYTLEQTSFLDSSDHRVRLTLEFDAVPGPEGDQWRYSLVDPDVDSAGSVTPADEPRLSWPPPPFDRPATTSRRRHSRWPVAVLIIFVAVALVLAQLLGA